jgi:hypothetical protein
METAVAALLNSDQSPAVTPQRKRRRLYAGPRSKKNGKSEIQIDV